MSCLNIRNIVIITVKNVTYHCIIHSISKSEAINLLKNSALDDRGYIGKNIASLFSVFSMQFSFYFFDLLYINII